MGVVIGVVMGGTGVRVVCVGVAGVAGARSAMGSDVAAMASGEVARSMEAINAVNPSLLNCDNVLFRLRFRNDVVFAGVL